MRISPRPLLRGLTRSNDGLPRSARHTSAVALIAPPGNSNRLFANTSRSTTLIRVLSTGPKRPTTSSPASSDFVYEFLTRDTSRPWGFCAHFPAKRGGVCCMLLGQCFISDHLFAAEKVHLGTVLATDAFQGLGQSSTPCDSDCELPQTQVR